MRIAPSLVSLALSLAACGGATGHEPDTSQGRARIDVQNPTGTCVAPDSGARAGYHSPQGATWLPDCQNMLRREYWRVFAESAESAYLIPRADGAPGLHDACNAPTHPLNAIVVRQALCSSATSKELVDRVNSIPLADALAVAHHLHSSLRFVAGAGTGITPYPLPSDIVDACALHETKSVPELDAMCERERRRMASGTEEGFTYSGVGATKLALRLNELYGIPLD